MVRRLNLFMLLGLMLTLAGIYGTAALTSLTVDRTVTASVAADNTNAAVKLECLDNSPGGTNYSPLCEYTNGVLQLQLHKALSADGSIGFNPDAAFVIGAAGAGSRVFRVTNQTANDIEVWVDSAGSAIKLNRETDGASVTSAAKEELAPGAAREFFFTVETPASTDPLTATLRVRLKS
jgi:hypothetical protein